MTKSIIKYICQVCGYESPRWLGKCPNCSEWNTFAEEYIEKREKKVVFSKNKELLPLSKVLPEQEPKLISSIAELNRVLGGGIVKGTVILIGGDPGIGKSTLMLQMADSLNNKNVLYITGEESINQIKLRSERLQIKDKERIFTVAETDLDQLIPIVETNSPDLVIVDSIQTVFRSTIDNSPGSVTQMRESTSALLKIAKEKNIPIFIIGHITKEGIIAGPKVIEHMVDTVLQFEGDQNNAYRILRCLKNRFGSTNEIGIFEMHDTGLSEVKNPSEVFLSSRIFGNSGSTVVASMEGTRPLLIEVQALVSPTKYGIPQRNSTGINYRRLTLLLAVLEKKAAVRLSENDVFVNIAGGLKIDEPAIDLGVAASIVSSLKNISLDPKLVIIGEIGLGGEIRSVSYPERRIRESEKLGFTRMIIPKANLRNLGKRSKLDIIGVETINDALDQLFL